VQADYQTFRRNRENETIDYASVDSANVFHLIEFIKTQTQAPVHDFGRASEIVDWLSEQWGGLFQAMLADRSEAGRLASLETQILKLENVTRTLKAYLEDIVSRGDEDQSIEIIKTEEERLLDRSIDIDLASRFRILDYYATDEATLVIELPEERSVLEGESVQDLAARLIEAWVGDDDHPSETELLEYWEEHNEVSARLNEARAILQLEPLDFDS
jgi:hypothetical protein